MELNHEELTFDQVSFWRFHLAPNLIDEVTARLCEWRLGFEAHRIHNRISIDPKGAPQVREDHQIINEGRNRFGSRIVVPAQPGEDAKPDLRFARLIADEDIARNLRQLVMRCC